MPNHFTSIGGYGSCYQHVYVYKDRYVYVCMYVCMYICVCMKVFIRNCIEGYTHMYMRGHSTVYVYSLGECRPRDPLHVCMYVYTVCM